MLITVPLLLNAKVVKSFIENSKLFLVLQFYHNGKQLDGIKAVYTNEEVQIPVLSTQKEYCVYYDPPKDGNKFVIKVVYGNTLYSAYIKDNATDILNGNSEITFKIDKGRKPMYIHYLNFSDINGHNSASSSNPTFTFQNNAGTLINDDDTPITNLQTLAQYLMDNVPNVGDSISFPITGMALYYAQTGGDAKLMILTSIDANNHPTNSLSVWVRGREVTVGDNVPITTRTLYIYRNGAFNNDDLNGQWGKLKDRVVEI